MDIKSIISKKWLAVIVLPSWIYVGFLASQLILLFLISAISKIGIPIEYINPSLVETISLALVYLIMAIIVFVLPWLIFKIKTSCQEIGLARLPTWLDILITPAGLIVYVVMAAVLMMLFEKFLPGVNLDQVQEIGFDGISQKYEYIMAFLSLVLIAPVAEEVLFRGFLFSRLKKYLSVGMAAIITSIVFGLIHGQWNLAIDTFALSLVLCFLRQITGSLWSPILLHMAKNGIAYYILFINPLIN